LGFPSSVLYVKSIVEAVIFLAVNDLTFQGDKKREADHRDSAESHYVWRFIFLSVSLQCKKLTN
jgi:hypothetical protein